MTNNIAGKTELKSPNQEAYCKYIGIEQKTQYESYCLAYPNQANNKRNTIDSNASQLMQDTKIAQRIGYLKNEITQKTIKTFAKSRDELLNEYEELILVAKTDKERRVIIDCLKEQGKLLGYYEDVLKLKGDKENPINTCITVEFTKSKNNEHCTNCPHWQDKLKQ